MYCIKCGRQIEDGSSFCVYCGAAQMKPGNDGAGSSRKQSAGGSSQGRSRDGGRDGRGQNRNYSQGSGAEWDSADDRGDAAAGRGAPQGRQYGGPARKSARGGSGYGTDYYEQPERQGGGILPIVIAASVLIFFLSLIVGFMLIRRSGSSGSSSSAAGANNSQSSGIVSMAPTEAPTAAPTEIPEAAPTETPAAVTEVPATPAPATPAPATPAPATPVPASPAPQLDTVVPGGQTVPATPAPATPAPATPAPPTPAPVQNAGSGDYIFPDSGSRYLSESELYGLSEQQISIAKNEIYARHGRLFVRDDLRQYFQSKSWYRGTVDPKVFDANADRYFNAYEKANVAMIQKYQDLHGLK